MKLRTTILSLATLTGISLWGLGVYSGSSLASHVATDGYGVSAVTRAQ